MKKLFIIACSISLTMVQAQKSKFRIGVRGGANISSISDNDKFRTHNAKIGFHGGLATRYEITPKIRVQSEVLYNNLGSSTVDKENFQKAVVQMNYITVPVLGQYEIIPKLYAETGPEFGFNLTSYIKAKESGKKTRWEDYTKVFHFGWSLGAGYHLTNQLAANARFNLGLISPFKDTQNATARKFHHNNFQIGLIYFFN